MRLIKARFDGFRLLDGVEFEFSTDPERNLTIIRAANESGKTTFLTALQWTLFGDVALPSNYATLSVDLADGAVGETVGEVTYDVDSQGQRQRFRLIRSLTDRVGSATRGKSTAQLFELTPRGNHEVNVTAFLNNHMPPDLREVFFTDGDRALSFIEGRRADQQRRVRGAIEQMMGLPLLEDGLEHVKSTERDIRAKANSVADNAELQKQQAELDALERSIPDLEAKYATAQEEASNLTDLFEGADRALQEALKIGDRADIANELKSVEKQQDNSEQRKAAADATQALLLSSKSFAKEMLAGPLAKAGKMLDELRTKGQIPNTTIPVLEDRLTHSDCICGESLNEKTPEGQKRRATIEKLIEDSRESDVLRARISDLYFEGRELFTPAPATWAAEYVAAFSVRTAEQATFDELGKVVADLNVRLKSVGDSNVQRAREMRDTYFQQLVDKRDEATRLEVALKSRRDTRTALSKTVGALISKDTKGKRFAAELTAAGDLRQILEKTLETMKTREVEAVSRRMNELFLGMIGADPDRGIIRRAAITDVFSIIVHGRNERILDPGQDLNGASRRALTLAFILALTEISGVEAPNVIDTPLGMMSGFVKREVVRVAAEESSQLVLLLTPDEIRGCEDILTKHAGKIYTMTNPAHYPIILKNDPGTSAARVILCECDVLTACDICDRKQSPDEAPAGKGES